MNNINLNSNFVSDEFKIPATFEDLNNIEQFDDESIKNLANEILFVDTSQKPGGKAKYYSPGFLKEKGISPYESKSFVPIKVKASKNLDVKASKKVLDFLKKFEGAEVYHEDNKGKPINYSEERIRKYKMTDEEYKRFYDVTIVAFANLATQFQPLAQKPKKEEKSGEINGTPRELYPLRRRVRLLKKEIAKEKQEREEQSKVAQEKEETRLVKEAENKADRNAEEAKAEEKNRYRERIIKLQNKFMDNLEYIHHKERANNGSISNKVKKY